MAGKRVLYFLLLSGFISVVAYASPETAPLPNRAPVPEQAVRPDEKAPVPEQDPASIAQPPLPTPKPDDTVKPDYKDVKPEPNQQAEKAEPDEDKAVLPDPRSTLPMAETMPEDAKACRVRLKEFGVDFEDGQPSESDPAGCALPFPLGLNSFSKDIKVEPGLVVTCGLAEQAARFITDTVQPIAKKTLNKTVSGVAQASGYVCRPRNGTRKLSEHAFGNAFDIAGFTFSDGTSLEVGKESGDAEKTFVVEVRKAACGPFKTVLGPGSDADHANHLHLDRAIRRNGGTFCQ
ncbi:extensin family protein [Corticibacterium sp. UT-5YL-CI-8]|nr:extensin family protein [Tianweitania sp. UT-5YL-CI-8]